MGTDAITFAATIAIKNITTFMGLFILFFHFLIIILAAKKNGTNTIINLMIKSIGFLQINMRSSLKQNVPHKVKDESGQASRLLVRVTGLEPAHLAAQEPKGNDTTVENFRYQILRSPLIFDSSYLLTIYFAMLS